MARALVLNASYEVLSIVSSRRAVSLVIGKKAELLHGTGAFFHSEYEAFAEPSVVRLLYYVKVPFPRHVALTKRAIFARDHFRCQYCGAPAENIDHVIPRSRGGPHTWENVVASCRPCNARKEDRLLQETNFVLRRKPAQPRPKAWIWLTGNPREDWLPYIGEPSLSA